MRTTLQILTILCGIGLFAVGLISPWFALPSAFMPDHKLVLIDSPVTVWWKVGCVLTSAFLIAGMKWAWNLTEIRSLLVVGFAVMLPLALWYPQAVIVHDEVRSGDAAWLQQQFDSLTWLGGDVPRGHSERPVPNGFGLWAQEPPHRLAAFRPPLFGSFSLGVAQVPDLIAWFGYNSAFSQFVARGWIQFVVGIFLILAGLFSWHQQGVLESARKVMLRQAVIALASSSVLVIVLAILPVMIGGHELRNARDLTQSWQAKPALSALNSAQKWLPALRFDTGVILQSGALLRQLGIPLPPPAKLHEAWLLSDQGYSRRSIAIVEELLDHPQNLTTSTRREAFRTLLRVAVDEINSSNLTEAGRHLKTLLDHQPICLQGWFHLQLLALESGDVGTNRLAALRVDSLANAYLRKESRGIVAASQWMLAQGEMQSGNHESTVVARQRAQGK
jgi:hypothetical protein